MAEDAGKEQLIVAGKMNSGASTECTRDVCVCPCGSRNRPALLQYVHTKLPPAVTASLTEFKIFHSIKKGS